MGSDLQVCLPCSMEWRNGFRRNSNLGLSGVIFEPVWGDGLPATGDAKAVAGTVINVLWAREVSWPKLVQFRGTEVVSTGA
jgi:hypothetical protein